MLRKKIKNRKILNIELMLYEIIIRVFFIHKIDYVMLKIFCFIIFFEHRMGTPVSVKARFDVKCKSLI